MQNSKFKVQNLRKRYPRFIYKSYSYKISAGDLKISFGFQIEPDIYFRPELIIKKVDENKLKRTGERALNNLVFHLGLIELLSYWKATCSQEIQIQAGYLSQGQIKWWKELFLNGLGQFFYENKINFTQSNFINISTVHKPGSRNYYDAGSRSERILVPVGGGKDSAVTLELLKNAKKNKFPLIKNKFPFLNLRNSEIENKFSFLNLRNSEMKNKIRCFSLNPTNAALKIIKTSGFKNPIIVKRKIDPHLLKLNRRGFLNGHTPISAYLAFLSVLSAVIFDYKYIALSNERSSNEGNVKHLGRFINHQYSKSLDFEKKFRNYSKKYLAKDVVYFSFLRPLYEIQIAKLFSNYPKYFNIFLSCNRAYQTNSGRIKPLKKWCGKCPKCLFVFTILYPFLEEKELLKIFGRNLFADKTLLPLMRQLAGERGFKPFECVGTKDETLVALYLSWKKCRGQASVKLPNLLNYFEKRIYHSHKRSYGLWQKKLFGHVNF